MSEQVATEQHLALTIEIPAMYTADIESLREFSDPDESESDHILDCIGEPRIVKLITEVHGEKESDVIDVYGWVREAALVEPSRGYSDAPHITDKELRENATALDGWPEDAIDDAVRRLLKADIDPAEIIEDLEWQVERVKKRLPA